MEMKIKLLLETVQHALERSFLIGSQSVLQQLNEATQAKLKKIEGEIKKFEDHIDLIYDEIKNKEEKDND